MLPKPSFAVVICLAILLTFGLVSYGEAAPSSAVVCVTDIQFAVDPGPKFSVSADFAGLSPNPMISFMATGIFIGGPKGLLTSSQLDQWMPIVDTLRVALAQKLKVQLIYEPTPRYVMAITLLNQPC